MHADVDGSASHSQMLILAILIVVLISQMTYTYDSGQVCLHPPCCADFGWFWLVYVRGKKLKEAERSRKKQSERSDQCTFDTTPHAQIYIGDTLLMTLESLVISIICISLMWHS